MMWAKGVSRVKRIRFWNCFLTKLNRMKKEKKSVGRTLADIMRNYKGKIVINVFESGSQHVERVENQYFGVQPPPHPGGEAENIAPIPSPTLGRKQKTDAVPSSTRGRELPDVLCTEKAMVLWQKAQAAGYVDEYYQPLISRSQAALLADVMARHLGIKKKWKVFEALWNRKYMRSDYSLALTQQQSLGFQDELKSLFG